MTNVINLTTAHSEVERRDAIDWAITDLLTLSDLVQMASDEIEDGSQETIRHAASMMYDRAAKLKRLMVENEVEILPGKVYDPDS